MAGPLADATTPLRAIPFEELDGCRVVARGSVEYEDGAEQRVIEITKAATDISSLSDELEHAATNWPELYHLNKSRANVLRAFDLRGDMRVLDVGGGCGAIARYLGETCGEVDVLEPMLARAAAARERTRDLPNVEIFVGGVTDVPAEPTYDLITVIGVLEYVGGGAVEDQPYIDFLAGLQGLLKPGGRILLAIENRLGVKYLAGAPEDHSGRPFHGIEGYRSPGPARTFSRTELEALLRKAGYNGEFYHAFPDYKLSRVVFSDASLADGDGPASELAWRVPRFPSPDWTEPREPWVDEELLWQSLVQSGLARHFSNSFVVVCGGEPEPGTLWPSGQLLRFFTTERRASFATETSAFDGAPIEFRRRRLAPGATTESKHLSLSISDSTFVEGRPLVEHLAECADTELEVLLRQWRSKVEAASTPRPVDLIPGNLIVDHSGQLQAIDQEWFSDEYEAIDIVQRGIITLAHQLSQITPAARWNCETVRDLAIRLDRMVGLEEANWLPRALQREAELQAMVYASDPSSPGWEADLQRIESEVLARYEVKLADGRLEPRRGLRAALENAVAQGDEKDAHIANFLELAREKDSHIENLLAANQEKDAHIANLQAAVAERDETIRRVRKFSLERLSEGLARLGKKRNPRKK